MSETEAKTISREDYYKVVGLFALADSHTRALKDIERAAGEVLGEDPDCGGYYGVVSDEIYALGGADPDGLLRRLSVTVEPVASSGEETPDE